jgi:regulator of protease activity HflC (stomatin/prohibitin superfamily)
MDPARMSNPTHELALVRPASGWVGLAVVLALIGGGAALAFGLRPAGIVAGALAILLAFFLAKGLLTLQPNEAAVLVFFGNYSATLRRDGFFWVNPFYARTRVSLRVRNFNTPTLKVNDRLGNPIEVAAVVTWRVEDTAQAVFDVEDYERYTHAQSEMALREVASAHAYDGADRDITLRGNFGRISELLTDTVQDHVRVAGIVVMEAKLTHLAYAPEIAGVMLRRQQAAAVVEAREKMVEGAIGMVKLALERMTSEDITTFTPGQRAALVTNMMTVLLSETGAQPVIQMARGDA